MAPRLLPHPFNMSTDHFTVRFWGVRGSVANGSREFAAVGGNTSCVEVRAGEELIILDAGTGLFQLGEALRPPTRATFLISHFHWDHIQGFPLFRPAFQAGNAFTFCARGESAEAVRAVFDRQMQPPYFPVTLAAMQARLAFRSIQPGDEIEVGAVRIKTATLNHPQGCLGYRISLGDVSVVYATDTEHLDSGAIDPDVLALAAGADLLIHDAQYTDDEYVGRCGPCRKGWGHSTIGEACRLARLAGVRQLALFHHDPCHDDRCMAKLQRQARERFPDVVVACEGMRIELPAAVDVLRARDEHQWHLAV